jgi:hypothetical protein
MSKATIITKNQFGEQSNSRILGGSSQLWCNFVVDHANGNGLGLRSVKSSGPSSNPDIKAVYMNTSATPAVGNPNPAAGLILVEFSKPYAGYITGSAGFDSPLSGTPLTAVTSGTLYVIVSLGTATLAQWLAVGLPAGVTPAVGAAFQATASATIGGSAAVEVLATAGSDVDHVELAGDPNQTLNVTGGGYIWSVVFQKNVVTAPADNTVVGMTFELTVTPSSVI